MSILIAIISVILWSPDTNISEGQLFFPGINSSITVVLKRERTNTHRYEHSIFHYNSYDTVDEGDFAITITKKVRSFGSDSFSFYKSIKVVLWTVPRGLPYVLDTAKHPLNFIWKGPVEPEYVFYRYVDKDGSWYSVSSLEELKQWMRKRFSTE